MTDPRIGPSPERLQYLDALATIATLRDDNELLTVERDLAQQERDTLRAALDEALGFLDKISPADGAGWYVEHARLTLAAAKETP